jgi:hypothetical protein
MCPSTPAAHALRCVQVWGESNITSLNRTANVIVGPQFINTTIRNGSTDGVRK